MPGQNTYHEGNHIAVVAGVSSADGKTIVLPWVDPNTHRWLTSASASGLNLLTAIGTVNGSNTQFTFTSLPTVIVSDGAMYQQTNSIGQTVWSWNAGTKTVTMTIPPQSDIFGIS
jgi:hypothetical protein